MQVLRNMSIRGKQLFIIMMTSVVVLLAACTVFVIYAITNFRGQLVENMVSVANVIGNNSTAALDFNDPKSATEALSALRAQKNIIAACVYDHNGKIFSIYQRDSDKRFAFPPIQPSGHEYKNGQLDIFQPIKERSDAVGTIFIASDSEALSEQLWHFVAIVGGMFAGLSVLALILSNRLQNLITMPILHLAEVANIVAEKRNYSVRATKHGQDEVGQLIDRFNAMLEQIEERDANLERRVEARTRELQRENAERRQAEEALRESQALYHSLVEQLPAGVFRKNNEGCYVLVNSWFCELHGITPAQILGKHPSELIVLESLKQTGEKTEVDRLLTDGLAHHKLILETGSPIEVEELHSENDGKQKYLHVVKSPVIGADGKIVGTQGILLDITQRKLAEEKLAQVHKQLMDASRQAGMAEVATSVLHNVGNVLNSVNVSGSFIADKVRNSKVINLSKAVDLMRARENDLGEFFTNDAKGKKLLGYLGSLALNLEQEREGILKEVASLVSNIVHIKEIVAMQQNYAKSFGVTELLKVTDLVEDAIRMNNGAMSRHQVKVVREFAHVPAIFADRHKVLQILINLIRNAKYACDDSSRDDKQITLQVTGDEKVVNISVIDNGIGIPSENLTRIFNHGFTTRKDGHGFGLHSGALSAKEMGGSLTVWSEGQGRGATFTLELPVKNHSKDL